MKKTESSLVSLFENKLSFLFTQFKKLPNYGQSNPTFVVTPFSSIENTLGNIRILLPNLGDEAEVKSHDETHVISFKDDSRIAIIYANNQDEFKWLYDYNSYFTSIIIGKIFKSANLKYSRHGLQYVQYDLRENHKSEVGFINITKDFSKILDILKFDKEEFYKGFSNFEELFSFIIKTPYFNATKFHNPEKEQKTIVLQMLDEYLILNNLTQKKGEQLTFDYIKQFFPEIDFKKMMDELFNKAQKKLEFVGKFNGKVIIDSIPNFDLKKIGYSLGVFKYSFGSKEAYEIFITEHSQEEILSKFKDVMDSHKRNFFV